MGVGLVWRVECRTRFEDLGDAGTLWTLGSRVRLLNGNQGSRMIPIFPPPLALESSWSTYGNQKKTESSHRIPIAKLTLVIVSIFSRFYLKSRAASEMLVMCRSRSLGGAYSGPRQQITVNTGPQLITFTPLNIEIDHLPESNSERKCCRWGSLGLFRKWARNLCIISSLDGLEVISLLDNRNSSRDWSSSSSPSSRFPEEELERLLLLQPGSLILLFRLSVAPAAPISAALDSFGL